MNLRSFSTGLLGILLLCPLLVQAAPPRVLDDRYTLELFATEPDIVTLIGAAFDARGRLLVIESHTHFPPQNYAGPKHDRIRLVEDTTGDGRADRFHSFYEGTDATMSLRRGLDDWIYVATRRAVFRLRDSNGDDVADQRQEIARLETKGNYPHNGLGGLAFDRHGHLYFGLGENLGEPYTLVAADGSKWAGGGEGGNVFRCSADGKRLERVATGFWNPFGLCIDPADRIFAVENDPDGCPPCRLLHVVPTGDYGFQFRYGRSGKHPLQAWDGELPGTLPMVAGTGEAPCAILPLDGQLWVTSWGENRIERFTLRPHGASFLADRDVVVQGDHQFRPVDFAMAPDGSLYFTDWVDRSYPVHGKGRIWRMRRKADAAAVDTDWLKPNESELNARHAAVQPDSNAPKSTDPWLRQAAVARMANSAPSAKLQLSGLDDPLARLTLLQAQRWLNQPGNLLTEALADPDERVRLYAVRWIADEGFKDHAPALERLLDEPTTSPRLFEATLATLDWLSSGQVVRQYRQSYDRRLVDTLLDVDKPAAIRATALRLVTVDSPLLANQQLAELANSAEPPIAGEAVRLLALRDNAAAADLLAAIAEDGRRPTAQRADAVMGLAGQASRFTELLGRLLDDPAAPVAREARRARAAVEPAAEPNTQPATTSPVNSAAGPDLDAWLARVGEGGDAGAGWRVFFSASGGRCAACHTLGGRGAAVGPDLTQIGARMGKRRVLESILDPSREIAPTYQAFGVQMADGRVINGFSLGRFDGDRKERFVGSDGRETVVDVVDIEHRVALETSIMPQGLEQGLSDEDLRDLLALLMGS